MTASAVPVHAIVPVPWEHDQDAATQKHGVPAHPPLKVDSSHEEEGQWIP